MSENFVKHSDQSGGFLWPNHAGGCNMDPKQVLTPDVMQSLVALLRDTLHYGHEGLAQAVAESSSSEQLLRIFPMLENVHGSFMINKIPNHDFSLT